MTTLKQVEERVTNVEHRQETHSATLDILIKTQIELKDMGARLDRSLANHAERMARLHDVMVRLGEMATDHEGILKNHERILKNHEVILARQDERLRRQEEGLEEMRRFNRQTRRLYILIARKANLLDDDGIAEWENDED